MTTAPKFPSTQEEMRPEDVGWLAGIIDGEGTVVVEQRCVAVYNTELEIVARCELVAQAGRVRVSRPANGSQKTLYIWTLKRWDDFVRVMSSVVLLMSSRKRTQVEKILANPPRGRSKNQRTHCRRGHEYTSENTLWNQGFKYCRTCQVDSRRKYEARKRANRG